VLSTVVHKVNALYEIPNCVPFSLWRPVGGFSARCKMYWITREYFVSSMLVRCVKFERYLCEVCGRHWKVSSWPWAKQALSWISIAEKGNCQTNLKVCCVEFEGFGWWYRSQIDWEIWPPHGVFLLSFVNDVTAVNFRLHTACSPCVRHRFQPFAAVCETRSSFFFFFLENKYTVVCKGFLLAARRSTF
jgi:hypothetical protein